MARRSSYLVAALIAAGAAAALTSAKAQTRTPVPPLVGATQVAKLVPAFGFIEDAVAADDQRIAYVVADAGARSELHVVTPGQAAAGSGSGSAAATGETTIDLSPLTTHALAVRLLGARAFVIGETTGGSQQLAALVELAAKGKKPPGTVVYKTAPVAHATVIQRDGKTVAALEDESEIKAGRRHQVQLIALDTGKKVASGKPFEVDLKNTNTQLDFRVNSWAYGRTRAVGIKGGEWDKKENARMPDVEATYDLVTNKVIDKKPITDLFEQRKRYGVLAEQKERVEFVRMTTDGKAIELWHGGMPTTVTLDQPLAQYDAKSLQGVVAADGSAWIAIQVDPVNTEAVARKKADPEYLDIYQATPDGKATRKARILSTGQHHLFGIAGDRFWLLERSSAFDRGGKTLTVYKLGS